ncbi:MAG: LacI family DNA-binding transcriptional regulator [Acidobacteriota bacterium]
MSKKKKRLSPSGGQAVSLKDLAAHVSLSPTTVSMVLNGTPGASAIPQETKDRIFEAARQFNYRPNYIARSLRAQRTYTLGVLVPEVSDGYSALVLSGAEDHLLQAGYFYFVASHRHRPELIERYPQMFLERCAEGLIVIDTPQRRPFPLPVVSVSGHEDTTGVTNIVLNHERAAALAIEHLVELGHRRIAVIKGQHFSSDTEVRWRAVREAALHFSVPIHSALVSQLEGDSPSPETGYVAAQKLLASGIFFTALFAFNDISAIGAIRALREAGRRVPEEVSVIGFDDVHAAAFHHPALTTIRQPLYEMGRVAAEQLLLRIARGPEAPFAEVLTVEPELVVRETTTSATSLDPTQPAPVEDLVKPAP